MNPSKCHPQQYLTGCNTHHCIVNITLHGTQSECPTALHLCISSMIYSNSVPIFFTEFSSTKREPLFLKTFMGFFFNFIFACMCVRVVLLYSLFNIAFFVHIIQGCTSFHFCVGYCTLFNMFSLQTFDCTSHHFPRLSYQISITVQNLWGFLRKFI